MAGTNNTNYGAIDSVEMDKLGNGDDLGDKLLPRNEEDTQPRPEKTFCIRATVLLLMSTSLFMVSASSELLVPFYPKEVNDREGGEKIIGFVYAAFTLGLFLGTILSGFIISKLGFKKMLIIGIAVAGLGLCLFAVGAVITNYYLFITIAIVIRFVQGAGASLQVLYNIVLFCLVADLFPDSFATAYGILETAFSIGIMVGPTFGGALFNLGGFAFPFLLFGIIVFLLGFGSVFFFLKINLVSENGSFPNDEMSRIQKAGLDFIRSSIELWVLMVAIIVIAVSVSYFSATLPSELNKKGLEDAGVIGLIFFAGASLDVVFTIFVGKTADTFPNTVHYLMTLGSFIVVLAYLFTGPFPPMSIIVPPSLSLTISAYLVSCVGLAALTIPIPSAILSVALNKGHRQDLETSTMIAILFNTTYFFGYCCGFPVSSLLGDGVGFAVGASVIAFLNAFLFVIITITTVLIHCY